MSERTVLVADNLGFCRGVERAVDMLRQGAELSLRMGVPCYVYGDIVHNKDVMASFSSYGIRRILSPSEADKPGVVVIRAHGITDAERASFGKAGFTVADATCPVVLRNQELVRSSDKPVIIVGYPDHAEVQALAGSASSAVAVISSAEELASLDRSMSYNAVMQTTFPDSESERILSEIKEIGIRVRFLNSVCSASRIRRLSVARLRSSVPAFVVVGDSMSANTRELSHIAEDGGKCRVFSVERAEDLPPEVFSYDKIAVTAGASTPAAVYNKVIQALRS